MGWNLSWWSILLQLLPLAVLAYFYVKRKYSYWSSRGIPGPTPIFPFGYLLERALAEPPDFELKMAQKYGRIYGLYSGLLPTLTVNDAELLKQILVKDFPQFLNRRSLNAYHELWNDNIFSAESATWKRVRTITSPTFSSGKLRGMYPLMNRCIDKLMVYLDGITENASKSSDFSVRQVITGFAVDVVASTSFATETDTNGDRSKKDTDPLLKNAMKIFEFNGLRIAAVYALPRWLLNMLNIRSWFDPAAFDYFINLTRKIVQQRKLEDPNAKVKRNDFVQIMVDSYVYDEDLKDEDYNKLTASYEGTATREENNNGSATEKHSDSKIKQTLNENEIVAQSVLFFAGGFETTSATITNCLYEMTKNPDCQERLYQELEDSLAHFDLTNAKDSNDYFELVNSLPYLDAYIKEVLRRYPVAVRLERRLTGDDGYKLGGIRLEKGTLIESSIWAVHHDEEYFPEPFRFDPDRFMPENKHLIKPYTYIPFGAGPRNCIGLRFAYQEIKLTLAKIVRRYRFEATAGTPEKLQCKPGSLLLNVLPFPLKICRRVN